MIFNIEDGDSLLALAIKIESPVIFETAFDLEDLVGDGVELNTQIVILFTKYHELDKKAIIPLLQKYCMKDLEMIVKLCESGEQFDVLDYFDLDTYNDSSSSYVILKLKEENTEGDDSLYKAFKSIHKVVKNEYCLDDSESNMEYSPHIILARVKKGLGKKYASSKLLGSILKNSKFSLDDFTITYQEGVHNVTTYNAVDRFFRLKRDEEMVIETRKLL